MKLTIRVLGSIVFLVALGLAAAYIISSPLGEWLRPNWIDKRVLMILTHPIFHLGAMPVTLAFLMKAVTYLVLLGLVAGRVRRLRRQIDPLPMS